MDVVTYALAKEYTKNSVTAEVQYALEPFVVTLTPTALDYSGTMDKTVAEIDAAYREGKKIVFRLMAGASQYMDVDCTTRYSDGSTYPSFNAFILENTMNIYILLATATTNDGTKATYSTVIYTMTPAS